MPMTAKGNQNLGQMFLMKEKIVDAIIKLGVTAVGVSYIPLKNGEFEVRFVARMKLEGQEES